MLFMRTWGLLPVDSAASLGTRVSLIVCLGKMLEIKVGVDLGGANVGVPQELLHAAKIATGFKQMGRK